MSKSRKDSQAVIRNIDKEVGRIRTRDEQYKLEEQSALRHLVAHAKKAGMPREERLDLVEALDLEGQLPKEHRRNRVRKLRRDGRQVAPK